MKLGYLEISHVERHVRDGSIHEINFVIGEQRVDLLVQIIEEIIVAKLNVNVKCDRGHWHGAQDEKKCRKSEEKNQAWVRDCISRRVIDRERANKDMLAIVLL